MMYLINFKKEIINEFNKKIIFLLSEIGKYKWQFIALYAYKIIVDSVYCYGICKLGYGNYGVDVKVLNLLISYIFLGVYSVYFQWNLKTNKISSLLLRFITIIYFIPITTWCNFGYGSTSFFFSSLLYWALLSILDYSIPVIYIKKSAGGRMYNLWFYLLLLFFSGFTLYISGKYTGFRIMTTIGADIYDVRAEAEGYQLPALLSYVRHFSKILIPILIMMAIKLRKYIWVLWGGFLVLLNFSYDGSKAVLFMGVLVVLGGFLWRDKMKVVIIPGCCLIGVLSFVEKIIINTSYITDLYFRREGILLAKLSEQYMKYFSSNPRDIFRSTFLNKIGFNSPYSMDVSYVIGNNFNTQITNESNGLLADVWAHLGVVGLFVMPIIIIVCFRLMDMVTKGIDERYLLGLMIYYAEAFTNATWSTVLLSHGFLVMCIMLWFFPREENDVEESVSESKRIFIESSDSKHKKKS